MLYGFPYMSYYYGAMVERSAMLVDMPRPRIERKALQRELAELPRQIAAYRGELTATPGPDKTRREFLEWQIKRAQMRLATIKTRLAAGSTDRA